MRYLVIILLFLSAHAAFAKTPDMRELRALYYEAPVSKEAAERFMQVVDNVQTEDPLLCCYKGMAMMLKANYTLNPYYKLSYFIKGRSLVEQAVQEAPADMEIRFMRFCAQTNAPSFLGYNEAIDTDKETILRSWSALADNDLKEKIKRYLIRSGYCSNEERAVLL